MRLALLGRMIRTMRLGKNYEENDITIRKDHEENDIAIRKNHGGNDLIWEE